MEKNENVLRLAGLLKENIAGINPNSARPMGTKQVDATVALMGNQLQISTRGGYLTVVLTPQQAEQVSAEFDDLV